MSVPQTSRSRHESTDRLVRRPIWLAFASGSGGLVSTLDDYAAFAQALLDGGGPILSRSSVAAMTTDQLFAVDGSPQGGPDATFNYSVNRTGGGQVHDGTLTGPTDTVAGNNGLGAAIEIGDTHNWGNVFAGNDYKLTEAAPPSPWAFK